ncbi:pullulanase-type alpha-1,6-glucosidase [Catenovulum sediminis]|uniref:Pullulanase-type alpha-1,6-glucosidase n=1 Tax=Catenovulum sediminis TaxID=1740262 RepID=A0ABV1RK77_9ALTE
MNSILRALSFLTLSLLLSACENSKQQQKVNQTQVPGVSFNYAAHWLTTQSIVVQTHPDAKDLLLFSVSDYKTELLDYIHQHQASAIPLIKDSGQADFNFKPYPHLRGFALYKVNISETEARHWIKDRIVVAQYDQAQNLLTVNDVQTGFVLDHLFTRKADDANEVTDFGASYEKDQINIKLWAPTAKQVQLLLFDKNKQALDKLNVQMRLDDSSGVWHAQLPDSFIHYFYQYQLTLYHPKVQNIVTVHVSDPYSLSVSQNGQLTLIVDLDDAKLKPTGWDSHPVLMVSAPEDQVIYETHVRDFSAHDRNLPEFAYQGKYKAFSATQSDAMQHLLALKAAGLNTIQLLPVFDIGTVNEDPTQVVYPHDKISKLCGIQLEHYLCLQKNIEDQSLQQILAGLNVMAEEGQAIIELLRPNDPYNWGYDPFHYSVPEGSYATESDGFTRIVEFREMVQSLHQNGFRVIMDVVYNHTYQAGLESYSVLDKIVPNYYHRLNTISGQIEQSTCCANTASERVMMGKLMIDSLLVWSRQYKIDGFRFDLMAHQPKSLLLAARSAVRQVDPDTYFYGEGWNFGEVADHARFVQASQVALSGSEIGTFTDRLRDAVRGGAPFDSAQGIRKGQGLANGLYVLPNELQPIDKQQAEFLLSLDQARIGLAGNLADYSLIDRFDMLVTGKDVDYGGEATGYANDPADTINYVSKHDNQTLWDNNQYRIPYHVSRHNRVRMQVLALAYPLMAQGIPFIHMGSELLRSKSFLRDSYDYGDWFNKVDFSKQSNNYNVGLPPAVKDSENWSVIRKLLTENQGRDVVGKQEIELADAMFKAYLAIRMESKLFRLRTAEQIKQKLSFLNTGAKQTPGLIVMRLSDQFGQKVSDNYQEIIVIFNHASKALSFPYQQADRFQLHPILRQGKDEVVKLAAAKADSFSVPEFTVAVFVR